MGGGLMGRILLYDGKELQEIDINLEWQEMVKAIGCDYMDIVTRKIGGKWFDIVCDDEFLLWEEPSLEWVTVMDAGMRQTILMGSVLFTKSNDEGETMPLSDEDIKTIKGALTDVFVMEYGGHGAMIKAVIVEPL